MKSTLTTIGNIKANMILNRNPVYKSLVQGSKNMFKLEEYLHVKLTNGLVMSLPQGYTWYTMKLPFFLRLICPSDKYTELPFLIYQAMYRHKESLQLDAEFAKEEVYKWLRVTSSIQGSCIGGLCIKIWLWYITKDKKKMWDN